MPGKQRSGQRWDAKSSNLAANRQRMRFSKPPNRDHIDQRWTEFKQAMSFLYKKTRMSCPGK
jgi:hypothetical protein